MANLAGLEGPSAARGFVLTPTYRVVAGRPEVHLHGVLDSGEPVLVIDDRGAPYFFVPAGAADTVRQLYPSGRVTPTALVTFAGESVARVEVGIPGDVPPLRAKLAAADVPCFEADVRFAYRYLIDRGIRGSFAVEGPSERRPGVGCVFRNPALAPADFTPALRVLAFDLETSPDGQRLYSIAASGTGGDRVFLVPPVSGWAEGGAAAVEALGYVTVVPDERAALAAFLDHVRAADPDVLTGWNIGDFDIPVLQRVGQRTRLRVTLGRTQDEVEVRRDPGFTRDPRVILAGRQVLDGLALVRGAFVRLDDYRLETAARTILGTGKLFAPDDRGAQIEVAYRDDPAGLAAYNLHDARLVLDILARTGLVELTVRRSLLTGMPLDRVGAQIAAVDSLYLGALRARGRVAPSVGSIAAAAPAEIAGGLVLDSVPGLYRAILVFDFKSLYPSLIRTFNIDPLTHLPPERAAAGPPASLIRTPGGPAFRRDEPGILPELVRRLWDERAQARAAGDHAGAQATKILMNSLFGVLGASASRLFSPAVANAITLAGQHVIRLAADAVARRGHRVIYGDTDSLFVDVGETDPDRAEALAPALRDAIGGDVAESIHRDFACQSHLELEFEKVYARFWMPEVRGGAGGSKKRYAGLVGPGDGKLELVGLEAVRRDWSEVARRFQRELLTRVFHGQPVADFVRSFVADLRAGRHDEELVYRKAIRKPLDAYTKTTPPHVKAARKQTGPPGRIVAYVMTQAGPETVSAITAPLDHEHYVVHQLRPIADALLRFLDGPDFDTLIGRIPEGRQLKLFGGATPPAARGHGPPPGDATAREPGSPPARRTWPRRRP